MKRGGGKKKKKDVYAYSDSLCCTSTKIKTTGHKEVVSGYARTSVNWTLRTVSQKERSNIGTCFLKK